MTHRRRRIRSAPVAVLRAALLALGLALVAAPASRAARQDAEAQGAAPRRPVAQLLQEGRAAEAEDAARAAVDARRDAPALLALAEVLRVRADELDASSSFGRSLRHGILEEALALCREAAALEGGRVGAVLGETDCLVALEREDEAEATLRAAVERVVRDDAGRAERRALLGQLVAFLAERGRRDAADEAIATAEAHGDLDAAGVALERLRACAAGVDAPAALERALAAERAGAASRDVASLAWDASATAPAEARLHLFSELLARRPGDVVLRYFRGAARKEMGDAAGAIADIEPCVAHPELGARARAWLGRALIQAGRAEEALPHFEELLARHPEFRREALDGWIGVAVARAGARRFADALALYERVLAVEPDNYWAHLGRPLCHKHLGDVEAAIAAYDAALEAIPDDPQLLNDDALLLHAVGRRDRALELFERALALGSADAGENLGVLALRGLHPRGSAADYFARTLELDPTRPRVRLYRELCLVDGLRR